MKNLVLTAIALLAMALTTAAQVYNGDQYVGVGNGTVTVSVTLKPLANEAIVTFSDGVGSSAPLTAAPTASGGAGVDSTGSSSTHGSSGPNGEPPPTGGPYRVKNGKLQEKVKGKWKTLKPMPKPVPSDELTKINSKGGAGGTGTLPHKSLNL